MNSKNQILEDIIKVSERIGVYRYLLSRIEDWSSPKVSIYQAELKPLLKQVEDLKSQLLNYEVFFK